MTEYREAVARAVENARDADGYFAWTPIYTTRIEAARAIADAALSVPRPAGLTPELEDALRNWINDQRWQNQSTLYREALRYFGVPLDDFGASE